MLPLGIALVSTNTIRMWWEVMGGWESFHLPMMTPWVLKNWLNSLKDHADVASYFIRPMYQLIPKGTKKSGMKAAIEQYITDNDVSQSHSQRNCWRGNSNLDFNCCPRQAWRGKLTVEIIQAWNLKGDHLGPTDR